MADVYKSLSGIEVPMSFYTSLTNPRWNNADETAILLDAAGGGSFLAGPGDVEPIGVQIFFDAKGGVYGPIGPYVAPVVSMDALKAQVAAAAAGISAGILHQVEPDITQGTAFAAIARMVDANSGSAPASGPNAARFAALAAQYGATPAQLAAIVVVLEGANLDLELALNVLQGAVTGATTGLMLNTALTAFLASANAVVTEANAALPNPITLPPTPSISGVNA